MSDAASTGLRDGPAALQAHRGWLVALGTGLLVLGVLAFLNLLIASVVTVYYVGFLMLLGGVAQLAHAFRVRSWGRFALWAAAGALYTLAGILVIANPLLAITVLTLAIAAALVVAGILRLVVAIGEGPRHRWGRMLASGALSVVAGLVIMTGWPVSSLWILGMFLAVDLIVQGWAWLSVGRALGQP